jgi:hypothetical protein
MATCKAEPRKEERYVSEKLREYGFIRPLASASIPVATDPSPGLALNEVSEAMAELWTSSLWAVELQRFVLKAHPIAYEPRGDIVDVLKYGKPSATRLYEVSPGTGMYSSLPIYPNIQQQTNVLMVYTPQTAALAHLAYQIAMHHPLAQEKNWVFVSAFDEDARRDLRKSDAQLAAEIRAHVDQGRDHFAISMLFPGHIVLYTARREAHDKWLVESYEANGKLTSLTSLRHQGEQMLGIISHAVGKDKEVRLEHRVIPSLSPGFIPPQGYTFGHCGAFAACLMKTALTVPPGQELDPRRLAAISHDVFSGEAVAKIEAEARRLKINSYDSEALLNRLVNVGTQRAKLSELSPSVFSPEGSLAVRDFARRVVSRRLYFKLSHLADRLGVTSSVNMDGIRESIDAENLARLAENFMPGLLRRLRSLPNAREAAGYLDRFYEDVLAFKMAMSALARDTNPREINRIESRNREHVRNAIEPHLRGFILPSGRQWRPVATERTALKPMMASVYGPRKARLTLAESSRFSGQDACTTLARSVFDLELSSLLGAVENATALTAVLAN